MTVLTVTNDHQEWAKDYSLPVEADHCPKCKVERIANIPFAAKGYRGLMSAVHECGDDYVLRVFRPIGDEINRWDIKGR